MVEKSRRINRETDNASVIVAGMFGHYERPPQHTGKEFEGPKRPIDGNITNA